MNKLLHSFFAGAGSLLSLYAPQKGEKPKDLMATIAEDFSKVGKDMSAATKKKAAALSAPREKTSHGEEKAEQLDLIPG